MNIIVLTTIPFPHGRASTHRLLSYLKGMVDLGHYIKVVCLIPRENLKEVKNKLTEGVYESIAFKYMSHSTICPEKKINKIFIKISGVFNAIVHLNKLNKQKKIDVILMGMTDSITIFIFYLFTRKFLIRFIHERTEYPFVLPPKSLLHHIDRYFYLNYILKLFDGIFVPTKALFKYFQQKVSSRTQLAIIPGMVKPNKFINNTDKTNEASKYIAYCGDFGKNKDGIPILIDSFKIISKKFNNIKLYLIGDTRDKNVMKSLVQKVSDYKLDSKVVFTGRIDHNEMPKYLCNASLLALARPANKQAEGGFPSKLIEYLETGKPIIITKVGEIPDYLTDGVTAFLCEPGSVEEFAEKLDYALSNPELAKQIGLNGQKLIYSTFNYKTQAQKLINFIQSL